MKRFIFLPVLVALLTGVAIFAHAQTTQTPSQTQTPDQTQDDSATDTGVDASDVAQAEEETNAETADQTDDADAEEADDSTARFIPTEQVSQDLGVSFPVDI